MLEMHLRIIRNVAQQRVRTMPSNVARPQPSTPGPNRK